jgi:hypothetical protein
MLTISCILNPDTLYNKWASGNRQQATGKTGEETSFVKIESKPCLMPHAFPIASGA